MGTVLIFQHGADVPPGLLGEALAARGIDMEIRALDEGDPVPDHFDWDGVVSLGGVMGAYQEADHPWIASEKRFLAGAVARGIPTLGLCLGCQMLADALGGSAYAGTGEEIGLVQVTLTPEGRWDPVLRHLDSAVPSFHGDTWDPPPGAVVAATTDRYRHAFRSGSAIAIQAHPEASADITTGWVDRDPDRVRRAGEDPEAIRRRLIEADDALREMSERLFGAWVDEVVGG